MEPGDLGRSFSYARVSRMASRVEAWHCTRSFDSLQAPLDGSVPRQTQDRHVERRFELNRANVLHRDDINARTFPRHRLQKLFPPSSASRSIPASLYRSSAVKFGCLAMLPSPSSPSPGRITVGYSAFNLQKRSWTLLHCAPSFGKVIMVVINVI
jgi:hypothetical protein